MSKIYAEQLRKKKREEEKKVVGQQQKTQPAANKPIGSTSIPKDTSRAQSSAASSLRSNQSNRSEKRRASYSDSRNNKNRTKEQTKSSNLPRSYENKQRTETRNNRSNPQTELLTFHQMVNQKNYSGGNGQTIGGGTIGRIPDASNLPMIGGVNQINDLDKYKINGQFDANSGVIDSRERAEKELENILYNRDAIREANRKDAGVFNSFTSGIGYGVLNTLGNMASLGENLTTRNPLSTEGMTPDEIYNRAMESGNKINPFNYNANDIAGDYNAYKEYVLSQMESGAVTPDEIQKMKNLEEQYSKIPAKRLKEMGLTTKAVNEGLSEGHPIANIAGQMVPMVAGNMAIGASGVLNELYQGANAFNNPVSRFMATQGVNLIPDLAVDTIP